MYLRVLCRFQESSRMSVFDAQLVSKLTKTSISLKVVPLLAVSYSVLIMFSRKAYV